MIQLPSADSLTDPEIATTFVRQLRPSGSVVLLLGAGSSISVGLPGWKTLVGRCRDEVGLPPLDGVNNLYEAMDSIEKTHTRQQYMDIVRSALYMSSYEDLWRADLDLFIALSSLINNDYGKLPYVVTLNYDDSLQWFLRECGVLSNIVSTYPTPVGASHINFFHIHGYLPKYLSDSSNLSFVLSESSARNRQDVIFRPWVELLYTLLVDKFMICVGASLLTFRDWLVQYSLKRVNTLLTDLQCDRPLGIWIMGPDDAGVDVQEFLELNVACVKFDAYSKIPPFIASLSK